MKTPNALRLIARHYGFKDFMAFEEYLEFIEPVLQQIAEIKDDPFIRWPIWIHGAEGTGKTTLARLLCADGQLIDAQLSTNNAIIRLLKSTTQEVALDDFRPSLETQAIVRSAAQRQDLRKMASNSDTPTPQNTKITCPRIIVCSEEPADDGATADRCIHVHTKRIKKSGLFKITVTPPARRSAI